MARTRSKSNLAATVPSSVGTPTDTSTVPHTSTLEPSAAIREEPARPSVESGGVPSPSAGGQARVSRPSVMRALHQLRARLDAIGEHSRELRDARRILIKREEALVKERDELVELLRSVERTILTNSWDYFDQPTNQSNGLATTGVPHADEVIDVVGEDDLAAEFEPPSKRKVTNGSVMAPPATGSLAPALTLIEDRPLEFQHASTSLPRPLEAPAAPKTPQSSPNSKSSVRLNGIRFPPGSAPRLPRTRSRSSSPFTQMLPPPVPMSATASPVASKPTKLYEPLVGKLDTSLFAPIPGFQSPKRTLPMLPLRPMLTPDAHIPSNDEHVAIPAHLFAHNPLISWEVAYMGPERTPSPPIGESRLTWAPKTRVEDRRRFPEPEQSVLELKAGGPMVNNLKEVFGPASRTRARVSNVGAGTGKGKGRA